MQEGMKDIEYQALGWSFHVHEEPSEDLVHGDPGAEWRNGDDDECQASSKDDDIPPSPAVEDGGVSTTVALPRRFGYPGRSDEDPKSVQVTDVTRGFDTSPESTAKTSLGAIKRKRVRKVTVDQDVVDYVKHFQEASEPNVAESLARDDFTRGLEQFCLLHGHAEPGSQDASMNPAVSIPEICQSSGAGMDQNRQTLPNLQIRPPEEWSRNGRAGDPYTMGYMDNMGGYFPNFCYPYPPPFVSYGQFNFGVHPIYMPMVQVPCFTPPLEYVHKIEDITKTARKSRVAKRRGHGTDQHHACPMTKTAHVGGGTAQSWNQENRAHQVTVTTFGQGLITRDLMLILQKQLSPSGVSSLGRIVLPKKEAETYLPRLIASEGVLLTMTDFDTAQSWTFRFRFWSNNKSRMYLLENTRDFVKAHNLQERDMLSLYRDAEGIYVVRGEKNGSNQTANAANDTTAEEDVLPKEDLPQKKQKCNFSMSE